MIRMCVDDTKKNIIIETDDIVVKGLLEYVVEDRVYKPWLKKWVNGKKKGKIYNKYLKDKNSGHDFFEVGIGWASYLIMTFNNQIPKEDYEDIYGAIYRKTYRVDPFPELRDVQNQDVLHILKFTRALFSVYTGYGRICRVM